MAGIGDYLLASEVHAHPDYNDETADNDIAILKVVMSVYSLAQPHPSDGTGPPLLRQSGPGLSPNRVSGRAHFGEYMELTLGVCPIGYLPWFFTNSSI